MSSSPARITIIFGPTASGKTSLAFHRAQEQSADILSYDSRQVYTHMDTVTGKDIPPDYEAEMQAHPTFESIPVFRNNSPQMPDLYGFNIVSPETEWSIAHFYQYAQPIITRHAQEKKPLIFVGGSWQYAAALFDPPESLFVPTDQELRATLQPLSVEELRRQLQKTATHTWERLNPSDRSNPRRLIRAIEVNQSTAPIPRPVFSAQETKFIFLSPDLTELEKSIHNRVLSRLNSGAIPETTWLMENMPDWTTPAFSASGYDLIRRYSAKEISREQLIEDWYRKERQYAKRQLTWVKSLIPQFPDAEVRTALET